MKIQKQTKFFYYIKGFTQSKIPVSNYKKAIERLKCKLSDAQLESVEQRVNYYNKLSESNQKSLMNRTKISDLKKAKTPKSYYFDTYEYARYFDENLAIDFLFGDVIHIPESPSIVKSRPVSKDNNNSVILNLDKARHFVFVKGDGDFRKKKNKLIGRCAVYQEHRYRFFEKYFGHPLTDLGQVNDNAGGNRDLWLKPKISIQQHLDFKFILSLQGNDVATNLKWIMSSNSIAVMPKPTLETWFMEGTLEGGKHFIEINSDYSNLEEQLNFYIEHEDLCLEILRNQHKYVEQFFNPDVEDLCSLLVLEKYFDKT